MAHTFSLILFFVFSITAQADFLGFGSSEGKSRILPLLDKLKNIPMRVDPAFEEEFNKAIKTLENAIDEEKLYCTGELADSEGKVLPKDKKQVCMRELKKNYIASMDTIYELKKKYLQLVHVRQQEKLSEIHSKLKLDIEKNF
jgi:hypothetical protein